MALLLFQITSLFTAIISIVLGGFVYYNRKSNVALLWFLTTFAISLWSVGLFGITISSNARVAILWDYLIVIGGGWVPVLFFHFVLKLLKKKYNLLLVVGYFVATLLTILNFLKEFRHGIDSVLLFKYWIIPGELYFVFPVLVSIYVLLSLYFLIKTTLTVEGAERQQVKYVLIAAIVGFGGGMTNFFPLFGMYPYGNS